MSMRSVFYRVPLLKMTRPTLTWKNNDLDGRIHSLLQSQYTHCGNEKKPKEYYNKTPLLFGSSYGRDIETQILQSTIQHFEKPYQLSIFAHKNTEKDRYLLNTELYTLYRTWMNYDMKILRIVMFLEKINDKNEYFEKYWMYLNQPRWYPNIEDFEKCYRSKRLFNLDFESFCKSKQQTKTV